MVHTFRLNLGYSWRQKVVPRLNNHSVLQYHHLSNLKSLLVQEIYFCGSGFARIRCTENFDTISISTSSCFQILQEFIAEENGKFILQFSLKKFCFGLSIVVALLHYCGGKFKIHAFSNLVCFVKCG